MQGEKGQETTVALKSEANHIASFHAIALLLDHEDHIILYQKNLLRVFHYAQNLVGDDLLSQSNRALDHYEDQASVKQFLVSSYKKNVYPLLKQEIRQNHREQAFLAPGTLRSK
ncbi:unnamed protein product [Sphenostylis stenocarpa]|uniref:Uncharacterized protein n=1 Tax=Sphenostylis stenocarpa TaxID=92480 RepID=A0AA86V4G2_9FABA|nr:unnamed protein product [Sphenostylis stenocarpa]